MGLQLQGYVTLDSVVAGGSGASPGGGLGGGIGAVSSQVGAFFFAASTSPVASKADTLAVVPGTIVDGAVDHPVWAAAYPQFVVGNDIVFPTDVEGTFLRNLGGNAAGEGVAQADATDANGLSGTTTGPSNQVPTTVNGGSGNTLRFLQSRTVTITSTDDETRPANFAFQLYTIVDI